MDLTQIKTKSGKTITDFVIPEGLIEKDPEIVELVMRSESMKDSERQYWFNLTKTMNSQQMEKLRDILTRESKKLEEIDAKYKKKKEPIDPKKLAEMNAAYEAQKLQRNDGLKEKEAEHAQKEAEEQEAILAELELGEEEEKPVDEATKEVNKKRKPGLFGGLFQRK